MPIVSAMYTRWRRKKHAKRTGVSYEHQPVKPSADLLATIAESGWNIPNEPETHAEQGATSEVPALSKTLVLLADTLKETDQRVLALAAAFLKSDAFVQYTTCARHPTEFLFKLANNWHDQGSDFKSVASKIVVVDAYSPHFGFSDSVHEARTRSIKKNLGVKTISSRPTYAGIHTAIAEAFNFIKKQETEDLRQPTLLVFEAVHALVDLESPEQYRLFLRHVIPSERMWGAMFTLAVETTIDKDSAALLRSYADFFCDSRSS